MKSGIDFDIHRLQPSDVQFAGVEHLALSILRQDRYLTHDYPHATESHVYAAFRRDRPVGFIRFLIQELGAGEHRTSILHNGSIILEAYVEAFGVEPAMRRLGIGSALQARAIEIARGKGCYQIRSRSPITSQENYALKLNAGYVLQPSEINDSYYFILKL